MSSSRRVPSRMRAEVSRTAIRALAVGAFALVIGIQSARVIERNMSVSHQVAEEEEQIHQLDAQKTAELRAIARLSRPDGAIPEIHRRLRYASDQEAIVYLRRPGDGANALEMEP